MAAAATSFIVGWEEWLALPDLGLPAIKAKIDTGAKTSALHAFLIEPFGPASAPMVRFGIHPIPARTDIEVHCSAPVTGRRDVTSSNGEKEARFVITTRVGMGGRDWPIEITLTNRESMSYRMLLGRQAIRGDMIVEPATSFRQPRLSYRLYRRLARAEPVRRPLRIALLTDRPERPSARRLAAAAAARGHVLERIDLGRLEILFDGMLPGLKRDGRPLAHYDAVIPLVGAGAGAFGAAAVRQLELMGSLALNSGDALDRLRNPLAALQTLSHSGIAVPVRGLAVSDDNGRRALKVNAPDRSLLVVGGLCQWGSVLRSSVPSQTDIPVSTEQRSLAERTAAALRLGLVAIGIADAEADTRVVSVSPAPALGKFRAARGISPAEAIMRHIESKVRSWVRRADPHVESSTT